MNNVLFNHYCGKVVDGICYKLDSHCPGCPAPHMFPNGTLRIDKSLDGIKYYAAALAESSQELKDMNISIGTL